jgi:hypothetical protein
MSAPGRSGKRNRYSRSSRASGLRPPDHVANVLLRQLVVGQVQRCESVLDEGADQLSRFVPVDDGDSHEDMGDLCVGNAVVELGDRARTQQFAEAAETASLFRNGDCEQGFPLFADLGSLGHEAQAIEVHVGAAGDRNERFFPSPSDPRSTA